MPTFLESKSLAAGNTPKLPCNVIILYQKSRNYNQYRHGRRSDGRFPFMMPIFIYYVQHEQKEACSKH